VSLADAVESIGFLPGVNAGVSTDRSPDDGSKTSRCGSVVALACTALIGFASVVAQQASADPDPASDPLPTFDFVDCPSLPAGADPGLWRCEVLMSSGTFRFGDLSEQPTGAMRLTFAEGRLDGKFAQVFGALRAEPTPVPGGLLGIPGTDTHNPKLRLDLRIEYAGYSDFLSVGDRMGSSTSSSASSPRCCRARARSAVTRTRPGSSPSGSASTR
jgi:hypothetical protein